MICERCGRLKNRATGQCLVCADHAGAAPPPVATLEAAAGPDAVLGAPVASPSRVDVSAAPAAASPSRVDVSAASAEASSPYRPGPPAGPAGGGMPSRVDVSAAAPEELPSSRTDVSAASPVSARNGSDAPTGSSRFRPAAPQAHAGPEDAPSLRLAPAAAPAVGSSFDPMLHRAPKAPSAEPRPASEPHAAPPSSPYRLAPAANAPRPEPAPEPEPEIRSVAATLRKAMPTPPPAPAAAPAARPPAPAAPAARPTAPAPAAPAAPAADELLPARVADDADRPISLSAAAAFLDLNDEGAKRKAAAKAKAAHAPAPLPAVVEPAPEPRHPGAPVGVVRHGKLGRRSVDVVVYDGGIVIGRRGAPTNLTASQLAAQQPDSRLLHTDKVDDVVVREDVVSGQARLHLRNGEELVVRWPGWRNRGASVENMLTHAFPGKVDQGDPEIVKRTVRVMVTMGVAILVAVGAFLGASALFKGDPPPPPPPAPVTTVPPLEQMARAELRGSCPPWLDFANNLPASDRPDPAAMRPIVDALRPHLDAVVAAGAGADYTAARDETGYLQDLSRKPADAVGRESVSRVHYSMDKVTDVCRRAALAG